MKTKILRAIKNGNRKTKEIISAIGAELKYKEYCKAIAELQSEGNVILTDSGYQISK